MSNRPNIRRFSPLLCVLAAAGIAGCNGGEAPGDGAAPAARDPAPQQLPQAAPPVDPEAPAHTAEAEMPQARAIVQAAGLTIPVPDGWQEVPPANPMRLAQLEIPGEPEPTTITFITTGGDVQANLNRWAAQFTGGGEPSFDQQTVEGLTIHTAEMDGTYTNIGEAPREGFALRGAVVEGPEGNLFIKMTGPAAQIEAESDAFYEMLEGIRPAGG